MIRLALTALISLLAFALPCARAGAQTQASVEEYKFDIGGSIGMSGYLGDANERDRKSVV